MPRLSVERLNELAAVALQRAGAAPETARITAQALVAAEAQGLGSHGLARVAQYAGHLRRGRVDGSAQAVVVRARAAACLVDAGEGLRSEEHTSELQSRENLVC